MGLSLYIGLDESNHAGQNRKGEIVVAVSSLIQKDSLVLPQSKRRDYDKVSTLLESPNRDYRFTILMGDRYGVRGSSHNLVEVIPLLVNSFPYFKQGKVDIIKLYLDGPLHRGARDLLRKEFSPLEAVVNNFKKSKPKKRNSLRPANFRKSKKRGSDGWNCPKVVYMADVIANDLYNLPMGEAFKHEKFIPHT